MDAAALNLAVKSDSVVTATNDLERFAKASDRAVASGAKVGGAFGGQSGSIAKLVAEVQSANSKLTVIVGTLEKIASAERATAAANDNAARSFANVDSHVTAYRQHLEGLVSAQQAASTATTAADAHVVAYTAHLAALARAQQDANAHVLAYRANIAASSTSGEQANAHVLAYRNSLNQVGSTAQTAAKSLKFTAQEGLNASRQLADIGVTAAMGMNPFLIAIQQGPQLFDILQSSAIRTGTSVGTVFRAATVSVLAFVAPFLPLIALLTLAAAGIAAMTAQANDTSGLKKYTTEMGYTKEEVKKLNAVTVTFGDTAKAVFQVGWSRIAAAFGVDTAAMSAAWSSFTDFLVRAARAAVAVIYAAFTGSFYAISKAWANAKEGKFENPFTTMVEGYKTAYGRAQTFMNDVVKQARTNARNRQNEMAKGFYDKPTAPKGPKPFTYDDLLKDADKVRNDLTKNAAQIGVYGEALARVTYEQDLLNKASERGLKLSPAQRTAIAGIAAELAKLSEANRRATFMEEFSQQTATQLRSLEQQRGAIGLTAGALAAYTYEQDQLNKAIADHITLTDAQKAKIADDANRIGEATTGNITKKAQDDGYRLHNEAMRQLEVERGALGLTGQALISYNYQQAEITRQRQAGVQAADINVGAIKREGDAYAAQRDALDKQRQAIADSREITRGFFSDFIDGARESGNIFKSFADSLVNSLNRIISKLADRALEGLFAGSNGTGGFLASILGSRPAPTTPPINPNALGGVYGSPTRFANGGAFTNTIVSTPTLFRFAKGSALGEMGEAGPEAIMPLKRGPNGALGVQAHGGGKTTVRLGDIHNEYRIDGGFTPESAVAMIRQGGEATVATIRRELQSMLQQLDTDGAFAS